jgi:hypothetical protein
MQIKEEHRFPRGSGLDMDTTDMNQWDGVNIFGKGDAVGRATAHTHLLARAALHL